MTVQPADLARPEANLHAQFGERPPSGPGRRRSVTSDKDFTSEALAPWNIEAKTPDEFVLDQIDIADRMIWGCVQQIANSRSNPPETVEDVLGQLERAGLLRSAAALRQG